MNVVLYLLRGDLAEPLPPSDYAVSVITELELLSFPKLDTTGESRIRALLDTVSIIDLSLEVREATIALRRIHRLKLPDAIIAATAVVLEGELLTNDAALLGLGDIEAKAVRLSS
jgi:predicted nucleic acid-binding protein